MSIVAAPAPGRGPSTIDKSKCLQAIATYLAHFSVGYVPFACFN